ncbi:N-substituted formamide deformylase [bacterium HR17]|uniref:N-substituted formamide deformylase n=1 Tax=Candidatus Fervidibacter japonicus TaxID=2035412 RepID=A0A2H5XCM4_9BACT|nr:N-substituted formamide deformylase [bacterium HR17]
MPSQRRRAIVNACLPLTDGGQRLWTIVLDGERIAAVIPQSDIVRPDDASVWDARQRPVLPGFIDAHMHPISMGLKRLRLDLSQTRSLQELLQIVRDAASGARRLAPRFLVGYDWDESLFADERRYPTRWDLDKAAPDVPVALRRVDGHLWVVNTPALQQMRLPDDHPFVFKTNGQPNGLIADDATRFLEPFVEPTPSEKREALRIASRIALEHGVTTVADLYADLSVYEGAVRDGDVTVRFVCCVPPATAQQLKSPLPWRIDREGCEARFVKLFLDGSLGARTAALREPYADMPNETGRLLLRDRAAEGLMLAFNEMGWRLAVHAIGDLAIDQAIEALRFVRMESDRFLRHRLEHLELLRPEHLGWLRRLTLIASMQPNFVARWQQPGGLYETRLGWVRTKSMNPFGSVVRANVPLAFGSDGMPFGPLYGIVGALTHPDPNERLTLRQALLAYTQGAAFACGVESQVGTVAPGKLADLVVLSHLPEASAFADEWHDIQVVAVFISGAPRFCAPGAASERAGS